MGGGGGVDRGGVPNHGTVMGVDWKRVRKKEGKRETRRRKGGEREACKAYREESGK